VLQNTQGLVKEYSRVSQGILKNTQGLVKEYSRVENGWFGLWCLTPLSTIFQLLWIHFYSWDTNFRGFRGSQQSTNLRIQRRIIATVKF